MAIYLVWGGLVLLGQWLILFRCCALAAICLAYCCIGYTSGISIWYFHFGLAILVDFPGIAPLVNILNFVPFAGHTACAITFLLLQVGSHLSVTVL